MRTNRIWRSFLSLFLFFSICFFPLFACGKKHSGNSTPTPPGKNPEDSPDSEEPTPALPGTPTRTPSQDQYRSVGVITKSGARCSGVILRHGVFATAKHCFHKVLPEGDAVQAWALYFPENGEISTSTLVVSGEDIKQVIFDGDQNDIAYVIYTAEKTKGIVPIDTESILRAPPEAEVPLHLVGFPTLKSLSLIRLTSYICKTTGKTGLLPPKPHDELGYDGLLYDTDCVAWFGNSGGPIFQVSKVETDKVEASPVSVIGVVSHTFDVTEEGDLISSLVKVDQYGSHVLSTNLSPFAQAQKLDEVLAMGIPDAD